MDSPFSVPATHSWENTFQENGGPALPHVLEANGLGYLLIPVEQNNTLKRRNVGALVITWSGHNGHLAVALASANK